MGNIKSGSLFGYVLSDIAVAENLREAFAIFLPIFNDISVGRDVFTLNKKQDIGATYQQRKRGLCDFYLKGNVEKNGKHTRPLWTVYYIVSIFVGDKFYLLLLSYVNFFKLQYNLLT